MKTFLIVAVVIIAISLVLNYMSKKKKMDVKMARIQASVAKKGLNVQQDMARNPYKKDIIEARGKAASSIVSASGEIVTNTVDSVSNLTGTVVNSSSGEILAQGVVGIAAAKSGTNPVAIMGAVNRPALSNGQSEQTTNKPVAQLEAGNDFGSDNKDSEIIETSFVEKDKRSTVAVSFDGEDL